MVVVGESDATAVVVVGGSDATASYIKEFAAAVRGRGVGRDGGGSRGVGCGAESLILSHCDGGGGRGVGCNGSQPQGVGHGTFSGHGNGCGSEVSQCQGWSVAPEPTDVDEVRRPTF